MLTGRSDEASIEDELVRILVVRIGNRREVYR